MTRSAVARRYARGLLEAMRSAGAPGEGGDEIAGQLERLSETVGAHSGLELLIRNPAIDGEKKRAVLVELAGRLEAGDLTRRFVTVLADNERLEHLHDVAVAFRELVDQERGVINAEITTPRALDESAIEDLRAKLAGATGREVRLHTRIDPEVLGGLVTRIGDVLYDGSLRHQLARMRSRMMDS